MIVYEGVVDLVFPVEALSVARKVTMEMESVLTSLSRETPLGFLETDPETGHSFMRNQTGVIDGRPNATQTMWMRDPRAGAVGAKGNKNHPINRGGLCSQASAALQGCPQP